MGVDAERENKLDEEVAPQTAPSVTQTRLATAAEPGKKAPDDLSELLVRAAMLHSQYREFESLPRAPKDPTPAVPLASVPREKAQSPLKGAVQGPIRLRPQAPSEPARGARGSSPDVIPAAEEYDPATGLLIRREEAPTSSSRDSSPAERARSVRNGDADRARKQSHTGSSRWSVLGQVLAKEGDAADERLIRALGASVSIPFQFAASVSGGTGVTTILATLARCLATFGEHLLVADPGASSLLPLYFGASHPGEGELQSFLMPDSDAGVSIVNSRQASVRSSSRSHVANEARRNLIATIRNAAGHSDRLLLDAGAVRASDVQSLQRRTHFALMPVLPDLSCIFGLMRLEESLQSLEGDGDPSGAVYYVLNKFDSSLALHRDIKASLEDRVGIRLAPVTIRRSDAVSEALADGMTVIDYCPDAGVAEDFLRLADWLRQMAPIGRDDGNYRADREHAK